MKKILQKISCVLLSVILLSAAPSVEADAAFEIPGICQVQTDTGTVCTVKTLDYSYDHNTYFSLRDLAMAFRGTDKAFALEITKNGVLLNTGGTYQPVGVENTPWEEGQAPDIPLRRNEFKVNGEEVSYYTLIMETASGYYDCFAMAVDLAMILDVDISASSGDSLQIHTQAPFAVSPVSLEEDGYFYGVNSVLAGDATTGEIYYQYQSDLPCPIASTTKLMSTLLIMDAISAGQITPGEQVTISDAVQQLAESDDGVIPLKAGEQITVQELLLGALLPSSNECVLCLAERIAGSEEAFVQRMNQKAAELGLSQAVFYNSHGLPAYTEASVPSKRQNRMSAEDMFRLVAYLLKVYPQITDITSMKEAALPSLEREVRNTNPLLRNLPQATGLKTGTTNKAGACLVTSLSVNGGGEKHDLAVIVFGAEDSVERGRVSELLARYALQTFETGTETSQEGEAARTSGNLPIHAEAAVERVLQTARRH